MRFHTLPTSATSLCPIRSSDGLDLFVSCVRTVMAQSRTFVCTGPSIWYQLPPWLAPPCMYFPMFLLHLFTASKLSIFSGTFALGAPLNGVHCERHFIDLWLYIYIIYIYICLAGCAPSYLSDLCRPASDLASRRALRSSAKGELIVPRARLCLKQHRAFLVVGPSTWNGLPLELRLMPRSNLPAYCRLLKSFLFSRGWAGSASE